LFQTFQTIYEYSQLIIEGKSYRGTRNDYSLTSKTELLQRVERL